MNRLRNLIYEYIKPILVFSIIAIFTTVLANIALLNYRFTEHSFDVVHAYATGLSYEYVAVAEKIFFDMHAVTNFMQATMQAYEQEDNNISIEAVREIKQMVIEKFDIIEGVRIIYSEQEDMSMYMHRDYTDMGEFEYIGQYTVLELEQLLKEQETKVIGPWIFNNGERDVQIVTLLSAVFDKNGNYFGTIGVDVLKDSFAWSGGDENENVSSMLVTHRKEIVTYNIHEQEQMISIGYDYDVDHLSEYILNLVGETLTTGFAGSKLIQIDDMEEILIVAYPIKIPDIGLWSVVVLFPSYMILRSLNDISDLIVYIFVFIVMLNITAFWIWKLTYDMRYIDGLTGLFNRQFIEKKIFKILERQKNKQKDVALIMCDIDNFKKINDKHGHLEGDKALKQVATLVKETSYNAKFSFFRSKNYVARFGGEEFMVCLANTSLAEAQLLAENIRVAVESKKLKSDVGEDLPVTLSLGVSCSTVEGSYEYNKLVSKADENLYTAKRTGKNKVVS